MENPLANLLEYDRWLFQKINSDWSSPWLDQVLPAITDLHREPLFLFAVLPLLLLWIYKERTRALKWFLVTIMAVGASDAFSYRVVKSFVERDRPEIAGVPVKLRSHKHTGMSFPSNHSANVFAAATVLSTALPGLRFPFFLIAFLVAYSRTYVGVHFPLDVMGGALIGWTMARLARALLGKWADGRRSTA